MDNLRSILRDLALFTYAVAGVLLCIVLWNARTIPAGVNTALDTINAPPRDDGHQMVYGTLSGISQTTKNIGILAAQGAEQIKQSGTLVAAAATTITMTGSHVNTTMDSLSGTADAASGSLTTLTAHITPAIDTANTTLGDVGTAITKFEPVEDSATKAVKDFDALVTGPVTDATNQVALTGVQVTAIATDIHKEADSVTKPQPWWRKALGYGNMGVNIACLATHSCPF
jgi:hypothetical protein